MPTRTTPAQPLAYNVASIRAHGLQARWGRTSAGRPCIFARMIPGEPWYLITDAMWTDAKNEGLTTAFERHTLLGDYFSIPA